MPDYGLRTTDSPPRFRSITAGKKLALSLELYYSARELKRAWLKQKHPDWDNGRVEREVRRIFTGART